MGSPSVTHRSKPPCGVAGFPWNQWQLSPGIGGSFALESVAALPWNQWQLWRGIRTYCNRIQTGIVNFMENR
jgi:hypothetical protein